MSDDTPTLRLPQSPDPESARLDGPPPARPPDDGPSGPSRAPLVAFIIVAVLVVIASSVLAYILVSRGTQSPAAPPESAPSASATSPAPSPLPAGQFTSLAAPPSQRCTGHGKGHSGVDVQVSWSTVNAAEVWVAAGTGDAVSSDGEQVPTSGTQDLFPSPIRLDCGHRAETFTMTLIGADGQHVSRSWTVTVDDRH